MRCKITSKEKPKGYCLFNDNEELEKAPDKYKKQILDSIISQNQCIKNFLMYKNLENEIVFKYFIKSKNPKLKQLVLEVSPNFKKLMIEMQKLNINWSRNSVKDFV
jgi:hypothetical protein